MAFWINYAARSSIINPLTISYKLTKHYSVLCSNKKNSSSNLFLNSKVPSSEKNLQFRNLSVEAIFSGVANSSSANFFINQLLNIHDCGIPWWATIVLTGAFLQVFIIFPMEAMQDKELSKTVNADKKMEESPRLTAREILSLAKKNKWTQEKILEEIKIQEKKRTKKVLSKSTSGAFIIGSGVTQMCLWTFFTLCISKLCYIADNVEVLKYEFQNEGVLWFKNLLDIDPYGLPVVLGIFELAMIELFDLKKGINMNTRSWMYISQGIALFFCYVATTIPAACSLFWTTLVLTSLGQNILLMSPRFRKFIKFPPSPVDANHPYKVICQRFKIKSGF